MSTVEGYELHVYCDDPEHFNRTCASQENWRRYSGPGQYCGRTKRESYALARRAGWVIRRSLPGITEADNGGLPARCKMCTDARRA